jgi:hypothetical protein
MQQRGCAGELMRGIEIVFYKVMFLIGLSSKRVFIDTGEEIFFVRICGKSILFGTAGSLTFLIVGS